MNHKQLFTTANHLLVQFLTFAGYLLRYKLMTPYKYLSFNNGNNRTDRTAASLDTRGI